MIRSMVLVLSVALLGGATRPAYGCDPAPEEKNVKVTVIAILGSYTSPKTDRRLTKIAKCVRDCCKKLKCKELKGFQIDWMQCRSLPVNQKTTFQLVEKQKVHIIIKHGANSQNRVSLSIYPPRMRGITYRTVCGKFLPIVTPYHTKNGDRLILAVRVRPCNGK